MILCCVILYCILLQVTLDLACVLLEHGGLPMGQPLDYFVAMVIALVDYFAEGCDETECPG